MAATGTIALNANSLTVTGSGTKFTTEAQVGGALVTYIGNVPYTFVVGAINSDTSITLTANYQGSNVSGQSFSLIDRSAYTAITAELGARTAQAIRGLNYDKANWQQILTGSGNVTVNVPDGSQYTGPSWLSLAKSISDKVDSDDSRLASIDGKEGGTLSSGVVVSTSSKENSYYSPGFAAINTNRNGDAGNVNVGGVFTSQLVNSSISANFCIREDTGSSTYALLQCSQGGSTWDFKFQNNGSGYAPGQWVSNSDKRIKTDILTIEEALQKMTMIRGATWTRTDFEGMTGIGFIAQSVQKVFPDSVFESGNRTLLDGTEVKGILSPDTSGVAAALHQEAILQLMSIQRKALLALSDPSLSDEDKQSALEKLAELIPDESEYAEQ